MVDQVESVLSAVVPEEKVTPCSHPSAGAASLLPRIDGLIKLASLAYAIGFSVIMVQTARLGGPVVEALEFQNIVAGLPVWLLLCFGILVWPSLVQRIAVAPAGGAGPRTPAGPEAMAGIKGRLANVSSVILLVYVGGAVTIIYAAVHFAVVHFFINRPFTWAENLVGVSTIVSAVLLLVSMQISQNKQVRAGPHAALMRLLCIYSGMLSLVLGYAIYGYPLMPQSLGGGRPVQVRILLKDRELGPTVGPEPLALYYRTSSYLLVSKGAHQPLIQIPMEQVRAVVWVDSKAN